MRNAYNKTVSQKYEPILIISGVFLFIGCYAMYKYWVNFHLHPLSSLSTDWGTFGDYVGGIVGTLFNILGVALIFLTFKRQEDYSHIERFETTFFNLLENQREIVKSLSGSIEESTAKVGYDYISTFSSHIHRYVDKVSIESDNEAFSQKILNDAYKKVYQGRTAANLGHYFRHLYHIIKYIDESSISDKKKYVDIVQSQMSDDELYCNFYNSISDLGIKRFLPLLRKYDFFENIMSISKEFDQQAKLFFPNTHFKDKSSLGTDPLIEVE